MRLPFVSRAHYELLVHNFGELRERAHNAEAREIAWRATVDSLLEKYHALKLQGAVASDPITPIVKKDQDPIIQQINTLSAGRPGLRAQMMRQLNSDRTVELLDDATIMRRIEAGVASEEGVMA